MLSLAKEQKFDSFSKSERKKANEKRRALGMKRSAWKKRKHKRKMQAKSRRINRR